MACSVPDCNCKEIISPTVEPVDHPSWYTQGKIEVIDFLLDQKLDWCSGNVVKYVCRAPYKGKELNDLRKARWYLNKRIDELTKSEAEKFYRVPCHWKIGGTDPD